MADPMQKISIFSWNARGFTSAKLAEIQMFTNNKTLDIICMQETHLDLKTQSEHRRINGYTLVNIFTRIANKGGGMAIYVKTGLQTTKLKTIKQNYMEYQGITVHGVDNNIDIYNCYVTDPDKMPGEKDINKLFTKDSFIIGDFNLHHYLWNPPGYTRTDRGAKDLVEFAEKSNRIILNSGEVTRTITYGNQTQETTIDLAIAPVKYAYKTEFKVIDNAMSSDHLPILITTDFKGFIEKAQNTPKWKTHKADWLQYQNVATTKFEYNNSNLDIDQHENQFLTALNESATASIPRSKQGDRQIRKIVPWWNRECELAVKKRESARKTCQKKPNEYNKETYRQAMGFCKKIILDAKRNNWQEFVSQIEHKTTSKDIWDKINRIRGKKSNSNAALLVDGKPVISNKDKANVLVSHYQKVSSTQNLPPQFIASKPFKDSEIDKQLEDQIASDPQPTYNNNFTMTELETSLALCKNTAPGVDLINYEMIRKLPYKGKQKLLNLFNQSWVEGKSPETWGKAVIIPLLKPGKNETDPAAYRPISLTSALTKIMQRMIKSRLVPYLETNNHLPNTQAGCRSNRSCEDHLVKLEADIKRAQFEQKYLLAIFLDLSNAFDRCWNKGVIKQLMATGLQGNMLKWIANFLDNRQISVRVNGEVSDTLDTENGCPQGSVLSPLLFNIIMNSLSTAIQKENDANNISEQTKIDLAQFVDDGAFWTRSQSLKIVAKRSQKLLNAIENWSNEWGFTVNPQKTQVIIFSNHKKDVINNAPKLILLGNILEYQKCIKFLGITFDHYLTWNEHIQNLKIRCSKDLNLLRMISGTDWGADKKSLMLLYQALIMSKINYGSVAFQSTTDTNINKLQIIQNKALRIISGAIKGTPVCLLQAELACMPIKLQFEQNSLKFWARTQQMGMRVPINDYMEDFSVFVDHKKSGHLKRPYCHTVRESLKEHGLENIQIEQATFQSLENIKYICIPNISLKNSINKKTSSEITMKTNSQHFIMSEYKESVKLYTDGSKDLNSNVAGAGLAVYSANNELVTQESYKLNPALSVFTAELVAIIAALDWIEEHNYQKSVILSDSLSALQSIGKLKSSSRQDLIFLIANRINKLKANEQQIELAWIPSHVDLDGNETADKAAKLGAQSGQTLTLLPSKREIFAIIKQKIKTKFQTYLRNTISPYMPIYNHMPNQTNQYSSNRILDTSYTRLRIGWGKMNLLEKMGVAHNCRSCGISLDMEHIFFDPNEQCPEFTSYRLQLHSSLLKLDIVNITLKTLLFPQLHTQIIQDAVLTFLKETKYAYDI